MIDASQLRTDAWGSIVNAGFDGKCREMSKFMHPKIALAGTVDDENLKPPKDGLVDLFRINQAGGVIGTNGNAYDGRIERQHAILAGFRNTNWLPGAQNRVPVKPADPVSPDLCSIPRT